MKLKQVILRSVGTKQFFTSMLGSFLIVMLVPTLTAIVLAVTSLALINKRVDETYQVLFQNITQETERIFNSAISLTQKTAGNQNLVRYASTTKRDYFQEYQLREMLQNVIFGAPYIEMTYAYLPQYDYILSNFNGSTCPDFFNGQYGGPGYESWKKMLQQATAYPRIVFLKDVGDGSGPTMHVFILRKINASYSSALDAQAPVLVTQLNFAELTSSMAALNRTGDDRAIIYSEENIIATTFEEGTASEIIRTVAGMDAAADPENAESKGVRISLASRDPYQIYRRYIAHNNISFIYAVSKKALNDGLAFSKNFALVALVFCIVTTIWLAILLAARKTTPIMKVFNMLHEDGRSANVLSNSLEDTVAAYVVQHRKLHDTFQTCANDFRDLYLSRLLRGKIAGSQSMKQSVFELYNISFPGECFAVAILAPEEPAAILDAGGWTERDHTLLSKSMLENTFNTVSKEQAVCYVISLEDTGQYACLLNSREPLASSQGSFYRMLNETVRVVGYNLSLTYHCFLSQSCSGIDDIARAYQEAESKVIKYEKSMSRPAGQNPRPELIQKCIDLIQASYHDSNLSVVNIAAALNVSASYLSRNFKEEAGIGLLDYIHQYRVVAAKKMISRNPNALIKDIAETTGFYSVASLIRVFKKLEGITPGEYRDSLLEA